MSETYSSAVERPQVAPLSFPFKVFVAAVLGLVASVVEPIMATAVIDEVVGLVLPELNLFGVHLEKFNTTPMIAACIFLINVGLALEMGKAMADMETDRRHRRLHLTVFVLCACVWLAMGVAMAGIRLNEAVLIGSAEELGQHSWVMALLMLVLHIGTGICLFVAAHGYLSSPWHLVRPTLRKANRASAAAAKAIAHAEHCTTALAKNTSHASLYEADLAGHLVALRNAESRLKDQFRVLLAAHLGSPAASGLIAAPHGSSNTDEAVAPPRRLGTTATEGA